MKLVSLNIWAGKEFKPLLKYLSEQAKDTDIFCFQEVFDTPTSNKIVSEHYRADIFSELQKALPKHTGYFAPVQEGYGFDSPVDFPIQWGLAMFIRKSVNVKETGEVYLFGSRNSRQDHNSTLARNLQYVYLDDDGQDYTIAHFHGFWNGCGKTDTEERLEQSRRAKKFLDNRKGKKILCGDFNLLPETKSLSILEGNLVNLITTHKINGTRSKLYKKEDKHADYTLVSPDVNVENFAVPQVEVSDHLPMILIFS